MIRNQTLGILLRCALGAALATPMMGCGTTTPGERRPPAAGAGRVTGARGQLPRAFRRQDKPTRLLGAASAKVRIEWFSDFQCFFCARAHHIMKALARRFPAKLQIRFRDYPLDHQCNPRLTRPFHTRACSAALYARCASEQGRFWAYADLLSKNPRALDEPTLQGHAAALRLDQGRLRRCLAAKKTREGLDRDIRRGMELGVRGTPSFYFGGKLVGPKSLSRWIRAVEAALAKR